MCWCPVCLAPGCCGFRRRLMNIRRHPLSSSSALKHRGTQPRSLLRAFWWIISRISSWKLENAPVIQFAKPRVELCYLPGITSDSTWKVTLYQLRSIHSYRNQQVCANYRSGFKTWYSQKLAGNRHELFIYPCPFCLKWLKLAICHLQIKRSLRLFVTQGFS